MTRKIIQISGDSIPSSDRNDTCFSVYALCDDGSLWEFSGRPPAWHRLPDVPQGETEVPKNEH